MEKQPKTEGGWKTCTHDKIKFYQIIDKQGNNVNNNSFIWTSPGLLPNDTYAKERR